MQAVAQNSNAKERRKKIALEKEKKWNKDSSTYVC